MKLTRAMRLDVPFLPVNSTKFKTYANHHVDLLDPPIDEIDIQDIAVSLSRQCRFMGHCKHFYSNAQHSLFMTTLATQFMDWGADKAMLCLLHDATEAYLGDSITMVRDQEYYLMQNETAPYFFTPKRHHEGLLFARILRALTPASYFEPILSNPEPLKEIEYLHNVTNRIELQFLMNFDQKELWQNKEERDWVDDVLSVLETAGLHPLFEWTMDDIASNFQSTYGQLFDCLNRKRA